MPIARGPFPGDSLEQVRREILPCRLCHIDGIPGVGTRPVPGEGSATAIVVFVGEGPGAAEEDLRRPFVGRAGQILRQAIAAAGLREDQVYLANLVRCRPYRVSPSGRRSNAPAWPPQIRNCVPYLHRELSLLAPRLVVGLGAAACRALLGRGVVLKTAHGRVVQTEAGVPVLPTYHPAAVLRSAAQVGPAMRAAMEEDLRRIPRLCAELAAEAGR